MSEKVVKTLKAARAKIEAGWTQGTSARNADGARVNWHDPSACSFCAMGALWSVIDETSGAASAALESALPEVGAHPKMSVVSYNDSPYRLKDEVLKLYDVAISIAGRET